MGDAGGAADIVNVDLTFSDDAASAPPSSGGIASGTYRPFNYFDEGGSNDIFPDPAPPGPDAATLASLEGSSPNGAWQLFIRDDLINDAGSLARWGVVFNVQCSPCFGVEATISRSTLFADDQRHARAGSHHLDCAVMTR